MMIVQRNRSCGDGRQQLASAVQFPPLHILEGQTDVLGVKAVLQRLPPHILDEKLKAQTGAPDGNVAFVLQNAIEEPGDRLGVVGSTSRQQDGVQFG